MVGRDHDGARIMKRFAQRTEEEPGRGAEEWGDKVRIGRESDPLQIRRRRLVPR